MRRAPVGEACGLRLVVRYEACPCWCGVQRWVAVSNEACPLENLLHDVTNSPWYKGYFIHKLDGKVLLIKIMAVGLRLKLVTRLRIHTINVDSIWRQSMPYF